MFEMLNTQTPEKKFTFISLGVDRTGQHGKLKYSNRIIFHEENIWNAYIIFIINNNNIIRNKYYVDFQLVLGCFEFSTRLVSS
jgi:hypothetical protein